ncbi:MAG: sulfotransferase domain-containing protein [Acidimicrobiales bacterium]
MGGLAKAANRRLGRHLSPAARKRLAAVVGGRAFGWYRRRRTDAYLVSFPKCGRTWVRLLLARSLQRHFDLPADADLVEVHRLAELDARVPCVFATHDDDAQRKTPEHVERDKQRYRRHRVILLVRDPRDVIVSLYFQKRDRRGAYDGSIAEFLDEPEGGFSSLLAFYDAWADSVDVPAAVLVVRYEDLHARTGDELRRMLDFIGVTGVADGVVNEAVAFASFDNMRRMEEAGALGSERLRPGRPGDFDTYKTRRGRVGGYRDELTADQVARLDATMAASRVDRLGYHADPS